MVLAKKKSKGRNKKKAGAAPSNDDKSDDVDYAAAADAYAMSSGSDDDGDRDDDASDDDDDDDASSAQSRDEVGPDGKTDKQGSSDSEERGEEEGASDDDDDDESQSEDSQDDDDESQSEDSQDDDDDDDSDEGGTGAPHRFHPSVKPVNGGDEQCTFDLRNLVAMNSHQVRSKSLYLSKSSNNNKKKKAENQKRYTIPPSGLEFAVNEEYLLEKATDGCAQLVGALWQLPMERSDAGPIALLPSFDESRVPRALPPPPPKQETRWEKFAKEKGIPLNKKKRSQKVWDDEAGTWMYRHGYNRANDQSKEWPIMEVKDNQDPYEDPWERLRDAKRARTEKNLESRMRNQERAGTLSKGTTTRVLKSRERSREMGKAGGNRDRDRPPVGVPVDLKPVKGGADDVPNPRKRGKESTAAALVATQRSTASLGKFDKMREGEPERKKTLASMRKRGKFEGGATDRKVVDGERERSLKLLKSVVADGAGGGAAKERARRKGLLAKGETPYDYDYDDGLGPSTFRKKKGRAGAGKMKKMTKKRAK